MREKLKGFGLSAHDESGPDGDDNQPSEGKSND
jgi:hypothetical protein